MTTADGERAIGLSRGFHPNFQMNAIGWIMFLILLVLLLPLLPVFVLYWIVSTLVEGGESE